MNSNNPQIFPGLCIERSTSVFAIYNLPMTDSITDELPVARKRGAFSITVRLFCAVMMAASVKKANAAFITERPGSRRFPDIGFNFC